MYDRNLMEESKKFNEKLKKIKVAIFDVDGVLTNGQVYYDGFEMGFNRFFHVYDGYGFRVLSEAGIKVGIVSGGHSLGLTKRADYLHVDYMFTGDEDKREAFLKIENDGYKSEEILYMGDEFFDIPLLKRAGFSAAPPESPIEVKSIVDYISEKGGGQGCVREVIDMLRYAHDIVPKVPDFD